MKEFDFNKLKDIKIDFPESWIENALDIPSKTEKKAMPAKFYRYAAVIAACVVLAAALTAYLMFGINKSADLTNPVVPSDPYKTADNTAPDSTDGSTQPQDATAALTDADSHAAANTSEPYENGEGTDGNTPQSNSHNENSADISQNRQAAQSGSHKNNTQQQKPVSSGESNPLTPIPATEPPAVQQPTEEQINDPEPETEPANPGGSNTETKPWDYPLAANDNYFFTATVDSSLAQGDIYCRIISVKGTSLGIGGLFDENRKVNKIDLGNGNTKLDFDTSNRPAYQNGLRTGEPYKVIFYNSNGETIKQGMIDAYYSAYYAI